MGFFSWWTRATKKKPSRPIYNKHYSFLPLIHVWMHCPGYGEFGGKDYYIALSECNPDPHPTPGFTGFSTEEHRDRGIKLSFDKEASGLKYPVFTETPTYDGPFNTQCVMCENQGFQWEDDDPTREVNQLSHEELKQEFTDLEEMHFSATKSLEAKNLQLQEKKKEIKRLCECLAKFVPDEAQLEQLTGKKRKVQEQEK